MDDNNTKLTKQQIDSLLSKIGGHEQEAQKKNDVNDFIEKNLTEQQAKALNKAIENPEQIKALLNSPQAKALMKKLLGKGDG